MENIMKEKKIKWIQKFCISSTEKRFKTLDDVLNNNNYDNAPLQAERNFEYTLSKKMVKMEWKTNKNKQIHKRGAENVYKNKPGPRRAAKSVKNPSSLFKLFFTDKMIDNIVQYTNKNMEPVINNFSDPRDRSTKYSHVKLVDGVDTEAFIDILYLRADFRLMMIFLIEKQSPRGVL